MRPNERALMTNNSTSLTGSRVSWAIASNENDRSVDFRLNDNSIRQRRVIFCIRAISLAARSAYGKCEWMLWSYYKPAYGVA